MTQRRQAALDAAFEIPRITKRRCDAVGCTEPGLHRAPKGRDRLDEYYWFCVDHIRSYNRAWNYFAGYDEDEIERIIRADTIWQRPTWPLGGGFPGTGSTNGRHRSQTNGHGRWRDPFELFEGLEQESRGGQGERPRPGSEQEKALRMLGLSAPITMDEIKTRYKTLAKRLHPDANGGDKEAEDRLKLINHAYSVLKNGLTG